MTATVENRGSVIIDKGNDAPLLLLDPCDRQILLLISNGLTNRKIEERVGFAKTSVERRKKRIGRIGTETTITGIKEEYEGYAHLAIIALIQDGINYGYLHHQIPKDFIPTQISERENEVLANLKQGLLPKEISEKLEISQFTVRNHIESQRTKLDVRNIYHMVARATYLEVNGFGPKAENRRGKKQT